MTVTPWVGGWYRGLSGDTKPDHAGLNGWNFMETDTGNIFHHDGSSWSLIHIGAERDYVYNIYIAGTTVKARNGVTGLVDYTADNTVNAVTAINSAINNIKNITSAGLDTRFGGKIKLSAGVYKCTTNLLNSGELGDADREAIMISGEGQGTILNFVPSTALTTAITLNGSHTGLSDLILRLNSNVTNGIVFNGMLAFTLEAEGSYGVIQRVRIEGANYGGTYLPITDQVGILQDPGTAGGERKPYWWRILDCELLTLDYGIKNTGPLEATSMFIDGNAFVFCTTGIYINGAQHIMDNNWFQGTTTVGTYGIRLTSNAALNFISNAIGEIDLESDTCATIVLDSGASQNHIAGSFNHLADNVTTFNVLNNSGNTTNSIDYYDSLTGFKTIDSKVDLKGNILRSKAGGYLQRDASGGGLGTIQLEPETTTDAMFMQFLPGANFTSGGSGADLRTDLRFYNTALVTNKEYLEFRSDGTIGYRIGSVKEVSGVARPLAFHMDYIDRIKIDGTGIGFFNKAPVAQPTAVANSTATASSASAQLNLLLQRMRDLGLIAT